MFYLSKQPVVQVFTAQTAMLFIAIGLAWVLTACTPAFNWRDVAFDSAPVAALLPCKPDRGERMVPLAGAPRQMVMAGCEAGGATFTVAVVNVTEPAKVDAVKAELRAANKATHSQYFQHGPFVVQASVYGTPSGERDGPGALSSQAVDTFFTGVKVAGKSGALSP
jgi:hypothetical protein